MTGSGVAGLTINVSIPVCGHLRVVGFFWSSGEGNTFFLLRHPVCGDLHVVGFFVPGVKEKWALCLGTPV